VFVGEYCYVVFLLQGLKELLPRQEMTLHMQGVDFPIWQWLNALAIRQQPLAARILRSRWAHFWATAIEEIFSA